MSFEQWYKDEYGVYPTDVRKTPWHYAHVQASRKAWEAGRESGYEAGHEAGVYAGQASCGQW